MQQVKIFKSIESEVNALEQEINEWLRTSGVRVLQIFGNIAPQSQAYEPVTSGPAQGGFVPSDVLLVVLYETS
jgi:hypothetical protein